jgi:DNA polymerase III subunit epsilon
MLVSRRLYPNAPAHNLATLVRYKQLPVTGAAHRALADAEMAAHLWISLVHEVKTIYHLREVSFALMQRIAKMPKAAVPAYLIRIAAEQC